MHFAQVQPFAGDPILSLNEEFGRDARMRTGLGGVLESMLPGEDFSCMTRQRGMFSYTGLTAQQVDDCARHPPSTCSGPVEHA
ncbi:aromatic amino acid aminotransferase [Variovorax sp. PBS-H4]|nr:aromatic amino acid aminotransferase [Variovorax sp. PBS-H4]